jgi:phage terminase large subunit
MNENDLLNLILIEEEDERQKGDALKNYESMRAFYRKNPLDYLVDRLGFRRETIDWTLIPEYQNHKWDGDENPYMQILDSLVHDKWCGTESAIGVGKTKIGAGIVLWFLDNWDNSMVVTTAPKEKQLELHIWREIGILMTKFNKGEYLSLKLRMVPGKDEWLAVGFVAGVKANEEVSTKAQGFHAEHMLIIMEETPGIPQPVIDAFQNTSVGAHNLILAFGNPDNQMDNLRKFCNQKNVRKIRISGLDHPNVVLNNPNFIPGAQSKIGLNNLLARYGSKEHPLYESRARGISPTQAQDSLIKMEWIKTSNEKYNSLCDDNGKINEAVIKGKYALGGDVANSETGDEAAIAKAKGNVLVKVESFPCPNSNQFGKRDIYSRIKEDRIRPENVGIDGVGVGAGAVNALHDDCNCRVISLIGSESALKNDSEEDFNNLRSQMWWQLREDLRNGEFIMPYDDELVADLITPKWFVKNGKICVESKEDFKKRLGRSPNKGDSVVYVNWVRKPRYKVAVVESDIL